MKLLKKLYSYLLFVLFSQSLIGQEIVDQTINTQVGASSLSQSAQKKIDALDEQSKEIYFDFKDTVAEYKSLKTYDDQLQEIINAQNAEIINIIKQIDSLDETNKDILPFLKRMIDVLREFITLDVPFLKEERLNTIANLDTIILQANVTTAEKFRKVFEAYQTEYNFGNTIETFSGTMMLDSTEVAVNFFRLGRIGFYYSSLDYRKTGYWDMVNNDWVHMKGKLGNELKSAIEIANRQAPPNFISLPIQPVERSQK
tara:strand:+ start:758 stop:1528 length:771 start_codon:yes stop_codon:yes gene_type:complete